MTIKQRQNLLAYLGYYNGPIDGDWGFGSQGACSQFQTHMDITIDGFGGPVTDESLRYAVANNLMNPDLTDNNVGNKVGEDKNIPGKTGTFWENSEFFIREEFRCQCKGKYCNGFPVEPEEELVRVCNEIRRRLGIPVSIVDSGGSGVRCSRWNDSVGGVGNSNHLHGRAADLHSDKSPQEMARVAEEVLGNTGEIGIYSWGIHVGVNCKYSRYYG